mmetsp:Transcript_26635/g.57877  ORF Transcript_26635/g.57877 Transcript_26635/m.57877 type:complete len:229 (-) Transcript_26635:214-900(-)
MTKRTRMPKSERGAAPPARANERPEARPLQHAAERPHPRGSRQQPQPQRSPSPSLSQDPSLEVREAALQERLQRRTGRPKRRRRGGRQAAARAVPLARSVPRRRGVPLLDQRRIQQRLPRRSTGVPQGLANAIETRGTRVTDTATDARTAIAAIVIAATETIVGTTEENLNGTDTMIESESETETEDVSGIVTADDLRRRPSTEKEAGAETSLPRVVSVQPNHHLPPL